MRILILNWRDIRHPLAGGAEISTHEHAKRWLQAGHSVKQFASTFQGAKSEEIIDGITIVRRGNHYTVHIHAFWYYLRNLRGKIDLIIDEFHFIPFFTPLYSWRKKIAFIHETAEEVWFKNQYFPINILGFFLEPWFFLLYKKIPFMTVSASTKKDLVKFGIPSKNVHVIHNGLRTVLSNKKKEINPTLIFLGRLAKDKGIEDAIYAFSEIKKNINNSQLWIVGKEEKEGLERHLKQLAKKLGIKKHITFFGFAEDREKYHLLRRAWVLVHPSIKEGWGLTVIEAASQGTPAVAYNASGLRDSIQDGKTGILVKERNSEELANKISDLLKNKSLYNKMSYEALLWSKKFDWEKSTRESLQLIEK